MGLNTQVLGISIDHVPCLQAWAESLGGIEYPLLSDFWPHGEVAREYGVLRPEGYSERAIFIIDRWGCIRYIDIHDIDQQPNNEELREVIRRIDPQAAQHAQLAKTAEAFIPPKGGITLYCTSWCPDCRRARRWFQENGLDFAEFDIDTVPGAATQVKKWANGNRTTPTIDVDGRILVGYNVDRLKQAVEEWQASKVR